MNAAEAHKTPAIIFVHGIRSSDKCWDQLTSLLERDARIKSRFLLKRFGYDASAFKVHPLRRIPRLGEVARALAAFIDSPDCHDREITLVGHSQGGLVILNYLADMVSTGHGLRLSAIRQVLLIATPLHGSTRFSHLRSLLSHLFDNPQERALRVLNPDVSDVLARVHNQIVSAKAPDDASYPVPIRSLYGESDGIVTEASARGVFSDVTPLPGDHSSVIRPESADHRGYKAIVDALLEPAGHANVFEVDLYEINLTVEPREKQLCGFSYGEGQDQSVETDNWASLDQSLLFSRTNQCRSQYMFRYSTKQHGIIKEVRKSYAEEAHGDERAPYDDTRESVVSKFTPQPGRAYSYGLEVYKGFDGGQRNFARRLMRHGYYKRVTLRLDLKRYLDEGYVVSDVPRMSVDNNYAESASPRHSEKATEGNRADAGVWQWEVQGLREGVLRLTWDVRPPDAGAAGDANVAQD